ncbi:MAG: VWA domain-containing protein [Gammaproteobacteria bacterium]|nr:VWA domain-containing protein [Gammaproteobacteria bacterium]
MIEHLHFVRPMWFYAFIPLAIFLVILYRRHGSGMNWKNVCDEKLLPYILSNSTNKSSRLPLLLAAIAASISIIAAAGPAFEKLPKPVYREQSMLVILMDLSQSMDAGDIKPSRIERAKLKLLDILKTRQAGQTALIVYAADAFVVTPLTDDTNTIASLVPTLQTGLMPSQGSNAYIAIEKSIDLMQQAGASQGDILLITDGISERDQDTIKTLTAKGYRLSVLGVGTEDGGPISLNGGFLQDSNGAIVIPKLEPEKLQRTALNGSGLYVSLQADDTDINTLDKLFSSRKVNENDNNKGMDLTADIWQEEGPWLLLLVIPLVALWPRKGWLLCLPLFILPVPEQAHALDMEHLWSTPDQKAMRAFKDGKTDEAARQFQDNNWKAASNYRTGNYQQALEALQTPVSSNDYYNRGNALAKLGQYPEAIKAYDEALKLDATNEDASFNREQVKQVLQQQQQSQDGGDGDNKESDQKDQQGDQQQSAENKDSQNQDKQDGDNQSSENKDGEKNQNQQNSESDSQQQSDQQQDSQEENAQQQDKNSSSQNQDGDQSSQQQPDKDKVEQAMKDAQQQEEKAEQQNSENNPSDDAEQNKQQLASQIEETETSEDDQAIEQWLRHVPDNPDQLLKRKFLYQYKNMRQKTPSDQAW